MKELDNLSRCRTVRPWHTHPSQARVASESPSLDSVQSLPLSCDGAAGFPWHSSHLAVGRLKMQQRPSTCPSRVGAFVSCCSIPNQTDLIFIFGVTPFLHPCPQSFHLSWEFQEITKMYPVVSYCSRMPIFLKDPFTQELFFVLLIQIFWMLLAYLN